MRVNKWVFLFSDEPSLLHKMLQERHVDLQVSGFSLQGYCKRGHWMAGCSFVNELWFSWLGTLCSVLMETRLSATPWGAMTRNQQYTSLKELLQRAVWIGLLVKIEEWLLTRTNSQDDWLHSLVRWYLHGFMWNRQTDRMLLHTVALFSCHYNGCLVCLSLLSLSLSLPQDATAKWEVKHNMML